MWYSHFKLYTMVSFSDESTPTYNYAANFYYIYTFLAPYEKYKIYD